MNNSLKILLLNFLLLAPCAIEAMNPLRNFGAQLARISFKHKVFAASTLVSAAALATHKEQSSVDAQGLPCYQLGNLQRIKLGIQNTFVPLNKKNLEKYPYFKDQFISYAVEHIDILNDDILRFIGTKYPEKMTDLLVRKALRNYHEKSEIDGNLLEYLSLEDKEKYENKFPLLQNIHSYSWYHSPDERTSIVLLQGISKMHGGISYSTHQVSSSAYIHRLEVSPKMRRKGKGSELIKRALTDIAHRASDEIRVNFIASPFGENKITLDELIKFYEKQGATIIQKETSYAQMQFKVQGLMKHGHEPSSVEQNKKKNERTHNFDPIFPSLA